MKTKIPFSNRCAWLCALVLGVSCIVSFRLVELQLVDSANHGRIAADELIEKERIPAQRGIIMDRNEEILTNNIQNAELVANRYHLREITAVVDGLAYNQVVHTPEWQQETDPAARRKLLMQKRNKLLENASRRLSTEEKANLRRQMGATDARTNRMLEYDPEVCEYYYSLHDQLVAELLYPYLCNLEITDTDSNGKTTKRFMTREDIIDKIAQPATTEYNRRAIENGEPTKSYRNQIILAKGFTLDVADKIKEALAQAHVRGIMVQSNPRRSYVVPEMLCHVLGYVNHENVGESGVEKYFQSHLAGTDGMREYRHNARGQVLPNEDDRYLAPKDGLNLRLTIDMRLQTICEKVLSEGLKEFNAKRGCMIVVDPKTGDILAMVNRPSFNLNTKELITHEGVFPRGSKKDSSGNPITGDFNFACQARYEPGSTFKVIGVTTAIDMHIMTMNTVVDCRPFSVGGGSKPINDGAHGRASLTVAGVLKKSSNPGAAHIALACKWPNFKEYLHRYGLDQPAGIDLPSGGKCSVLNGENIVNFSRMAYGYSVAVSPLHMAMVYATIANDGVRMKPRLIDKIIAADGSVYDECEPVAVQRVMSPETAKSLREALYGVTQSTGTDGQGTATRAHIPGFRIGGKTGTAKKVREDGKGYYEGLYTVSFAGVLPIDDPRLVVMTVIDEPHPTKCQAGGGTVAAPIFRNAAEQFIKVLGIQPSDPAAYEKHLKSQSNGATD